MERVTHRPQVPPLPPPRYSASSVFLTRSHSFPHPLCVHGGPHSCPHPFPLWLMLSAPPPPTGPQKADPSRTAQTHPGHPRPNIKRPPR